jgi:hypothetical protein
MSLILVRLLVKLAHTTGSPGQRCVSNLDLALACSQRWQQDVVSDWEQIPRPIRVYISGMRKKSKDSMTPARATIASVQKEMQKPRLTASVRNGGTDQAVPVAEKSLARSRRARASDDRPRA